MELPEDLEIPLVPNKNVQEQALWENLPKGGDDELVQMARFSPYLSPLVLSGAQLKNLLDACGGLDRFPMVKLPIECLLPMCNWESATLYHIALYVFKYATLAPSIRLSVVKLRDRASSIATPPRPTKKGGPLDRAYAICGVRPESVGLSRFNL